MIATFAFDKNVSPVTAMAGARIVRHQPVEYMSLCQFNNVYWDFDKERNYAPCLIFEGDVERLDVINEKFPGNVDTVYFNDSKPSIRFKYNLNDAQYGELASKGFWSEDGVNLPALFMSAKFQLETYAIVEEVVNKKEASEIPIFNIELVKPYENQFDASTYELVDKIVRRKPDTQKSIENIVSIEDQIQAENEVAVKNIEDEARPKDFVPLSESELDIHNKSNNIDISVAAERNALRNSRNAGNARAEVERRIEQERLKANQDTLSDSGADDKTIDLKDAENMVLSDRSETNKYKDNDEIFNGLKGGNEELPDKAAEFMKKLGGVSGADDTAVAQKKDSKRDDNAGSGAASGTQGLGVYTFEDQSTAQFEVRSDEGVGNEKDEAEYDDDSQSEDKRDDNPVGIDQRYKFAMPIKEISSDNLKSDDKNGMSK